MSQETFHSSQKQTFTDYTRNTKPERPSRFLVQLYNQVSIYAKRALAQTVSPEWKRFLRHLSHRWVL